MRRYLLLLAGAASLFGAPPSITETTYHGKSAWAITNGLIHVTVIADGGHIAEMRLISGDPKASINPMWIPPDPQPPVSYMGHLVCFPSYWPPSREESAAVLTGPGDASMAMWNTIQSVS